MVRWMRKRWGLRAKMAGSYVLVTAAAVAVVEAVVLVLVVPGLLGAQDAHTLLVRLTATCSGASGSAARESMSRTAAVRSVCART